MAFLLRCKNKFEGVGCMNHAAKNNRMCWECLYNNLKQENEKLKQAIRLWKNACSSSDIISAEKRLDEILTKEK